MIVFCTDLSSNIVFFIQTVANVESDGWWWVYWILSWISFWVFLKVECRHLKRSVSKEMFLKVATFHFLGSPVILQLLYVPSVLLVLIQNAIFKFNISLLNEFVLNRSLFS